MNIEEFREYCLSFEGVTEKTPFGKFARRYESILVFYVLDHMFCLVDMDDFTSVNVKSTPEEIERLRQNHTSLGDPVNLDKRYWIRLDFNGDIPEPEILRMVGRSYDIIKLKYTPKQRRPAKS